MRQVGGECLATHPRTHTHTLTHPHSNPPTLGAGSVHGSDSDVTVTVNVPRVCLQAEALILRRIAELLRDQQAAIAHGAATAEFDRDASASHRTKERALTSEILGWACLRQDFQRSPDFLRSALIAEIRQVSGDVDAIVEQNYLAGVLDEVCQALQEGEVAQQLQQRLTTTTTPTVNYQHLSIIQTL